MNLLAVVWAGIAFVGVAVSVFAQRDHVKDRGALGSRNGVLRLLVMTRLRRERVRFVGLCAFFVAGVLAAIPGTDDIERVAIYVCLYGGTIALIINGLLEQLDRAAIRELFQ